MHVTFSSVLVLACTAIATFQGDSDDDEKVIYPEDHHHHHHHGFEEKDVIEKEGSGNNSISEVETVLKRNLFVVLIATALQIPLEFVQELSNYSTSELLARFVEGEEQSDEQIFLQGNFIYCY